MDNSNVAFHANFENRKFAYDIFKVLKDQFVSKICKGNKNEASFGWLLVGIVLCGHFVIRNAKEDDVTFVVKQKVSKEDELEFDRLVVNPEGVVELSGLLDEVSVARVQVQRGRNLLPERILRIVSSLKPPRMIRSNETALRSVIKRLTWSWLSLRFPFSSWKLTATVSIHALSVFLGSST